ncbi:MAG: phosphoribosylformylglycinamidine synthase subunit PurQ [Pseudomonadota bacterium]
MAKVLVLAGYGLNCEEETLHAFNYNGLDGTIRHINDLIENPKELEQFQILAIPGGFSYGDDTGAGNGYAQKMKLALWDDLKKFVERDTLTIGICNGCQILANLGMVPGFNGNYGARDIAVTYNATERYQCRWVDLKVKSSSPWLEGASSMHIPVAHGEGRFMMSDETLGKLKENGQIAATYVKPDGSAANEEFPFNPNGSVADIAAITDESGKVLAIMPHPERGMFTWQRDDFDRLKDKAQRDGATLPETTDGMTLFSNAAKYFGIAKKKAA